jgi:WD40 repeat protein
VLQGHTGPIYGAVFAPDGRRILTASSDKTGRLWSREGKLLATLSGHTGKITKAAFAPGGRRILTASTDGTARVWDSEGKPLGMLEGHTGPVNDAIFSQDGARILTLSDDGTARVWESFMKSQDLVDQAKADVPRCLTPEQRLVYFLPAEPPTWCRSMNKWPYDVTTQTAQAH